MSAIDPELKALICAGEAAIRCGHCSRVAALDDFCRTEVSGELPPGRFQCPHCGRAWAVVPDGKPKVYPSGFVMPPPNKIVEVEAVM